MAKKSKRRKIIIKKDEVPYVPPTIELNTKLFKFKAHGRLAVKISAIILGGSVLVGLLYVYLKYYNN